MILLVDADSPTPPFEQIRSQVTAMVTSGVLQEGSRLPTIRQLSSDLGLAGGTIARAYRELEAEGVIETRGRRGTFVASVRRDRDDRNGLLDDAARSLALRAVQLGADRKATRDALERAFAAVEGGGGA